MLPTSGRPAGQDGANMRAVLALTSLTFPASLVAIELYAFCKCSALTNVDFSAVSDASIGRCAFLGCERLAKLTLPTALSRLDEYAFAHCSALVEFTPSHSPPP